VSFLTKEADRKYKLSKKIWPKVAVLGGDGREMMVAEACVQRGWQVAVYGRPAAILPAQVQHAAQAGEALSGASAVVLPAPPVRDGGRLYNAEGLELTVAEEDFACLPAGTPLLAGVLSPFIRQVGARYQLHLIETLELDEVALPFAVATAEGAIALAIGATGNVVDQEQALIIGYGRIGRALAPRLRGLNMAVMVANRGVPRLTQAAGEGFATVSWPGWPAATRDCAFIFNTAPQLLLDSTVLPLLKCDTVIIDLAATPGGTDFTLAKSLGLQAMLAGGLPGKYAPCFAGKVMAEFYPRLLEQHLKEGGR